MQRREEENGGRQSHLLFWRRQRRGVYFCVKFYFSHCGTRSEHLVPKPQTASKLPVGRLGRLQTESDSVSVMSILMCHHNARRGVMLRASAGCCCILCLDILPGWLVAKTLCFVQGRLCLGSFSLFFLSLFLYKREDISVCAHACFLSLFFIHQPPFGHVSFFPPHFLFSLPSDLP